MANTTANSFDVACGTIKKTIDKYDGKIPFGFNPKAEGLLSAEQVRDSLAQQMQGVVREMDALRKGSKDRACVDIAFEDYMKTKLGFSSLSSLYNAMGIDPSRQTINSLSAGMGDFSEGYRWLIPEVFRAAISLGLRKNPNYPSWIAQEESVDQLKVTLPAINMSAATPSPVNEAETIPMGDVSFQQRDVKIRKIGIGTRVSDEVLQYVNLNIVSLFLQDMGVQLGLGLDTEALDVLVNGDDPAGTYSASVIGVANTTNGITYEDILRMWIRMGRLGRMPTAIITDEVEGIKLYQMDEFKGANYNNKKQNLNLRTAIPQSQDVYIHGAMPSGQKLGFLDATSALIKLNATGLLVESDRLAERQVTGAYATVTTGFARMFQDAFTILDGTLAFSANGFPASMDMNAAERVSMFGK